jgi:hypothetical protein
MAHELAHKVPRTLTMTVTATIAGAVAMLAISAVLRRPDRNPPLGLAIMLLA